MGYLAVLSVTFVVGLIVNAMFLGLLSQYLFGTVQDWVFVLASGVAGFGAVLSAEQYQRWSDPSAAGG